MTSTETLLSTKEFSERSGIPTSTLQKWLRGAKLTGTKKNRRWFIPESELMRLSTPSKTPLSDVPNPGNNAGASSRVFSVAEFSAMTYLTELGVRHFLKSGRLLGDRADDGSWTVRAESLKLPHLKHLIR